MLKMNLDTSIDNINYLYYMNTQQKIDNDRKQKSKDDLEFERATTNGERGTIDKNSRNPGLHN